MSNDHPAIERAKRDLTKLQSQIEIAERGLVELRLKVSKVATFISVSEQYAKELNEEQTHEECVPAPEVRRRLPDRILRGGDVS